MRSVGGPSEIVSWMYGSATSASALNVVSRFAYICPWVSATGATAAALWARPFQKPWRSVFALARLRMTGVRLSSSGLRSRIVKFRSAPREAKPAPKFVRLPWIARRVRSGNMSKNSSSSTGWGSAWRSGIVEFAARSCVDVPRVSWTYFRPSADRGRIFTRVSAGSGLTTVSSFRHSTAMTSPLGCVCGSMQETVPTRVPPTRTSLPFTSPAAFGTSTLRSYVGTNGRPEFAL